MDNIFHRAAAQKDNAFTQKRDKDLHIKSDLSGDEVIKKSISLYKSDLETLAKLETELQKYHRKNLKTSAVIRVAIEVLNEIIKNPSERQNELIKMAVNKSL